MRERRAHRLCGIDPRSSAVAADGRSAAARNVLLVTVAHELSIRNLIARLAHATDVGTIAEYAACFAEPASMVVGESAVRTGRSEIAEAMERSRGQGSFGPGSGSIHVIGASTVEVSADQAAGVTTFLFIVGASGQKALAGAGRYIDSFTRTADGWCLAHRRVELA